MRIEYFSYRFALEILESQNYIFALNEIYQIFSESPFFIFPGKSNKNAKLDIVQQVMNTYFDRRFSIDHGWSYHPPATRIPGSNLSADYHKTFGDLPIQVEVQFGNMSRWYSDIFKFQTAYAQSLAKLAISVVPMSETAKRIDSNIVNFERAKRELLSADLSITLPILMIGVGIDGNSEFVDISKTQFSIKEITGKGMIENRLRIVHNNLNNVPLEKIGPNSEVGPIPRTSLEETPLS